MKFLPGWRKATWALVIFNVLMLVWLVTGLNAVGETPCDPNLTAELCDSATAIGAGIGVTFLVIIWFLGFVILGLVWLMSRPKENTVVYSPEGAEVHTSQKEARRLVTKQGWKYTRESGSS